MLVVTYVRACAENSSSVFFQTADSQNNIFGRTLNPWNTSLTPGGSSGGEGALVAFRGSPLGVGTDVAGSIRIPSICCGTYGFKPTASRVPYGKQAPLGNPGLRNILASAGPLTNDFDALEIFMKAVLDAQPAKLDVTAINVPWRPFQEVKPTLRFGVLAEDPLFPLQPHVKKGIAEVASQLQAQGHEMVPLTADEGHVARSWDVAMQIFGLDKSSVATVLKSGEPFIPSIVAARGQTRGIQFDRDFLPDTRTIEDGLDKLALLNIKRVQLQESWRATFVRRGLDAVVAPGAPNTAIEHDEYGPAPYTALLNFLDVCGISPPPFFFSLVVVMMPDVFEALLTYFFGHFPLVSLLRDSVWKGDQVTSCWGV